MSALLLLAKADPYHAIAVTSAVGPADPLVWTALAQRTAARALAEGVLHTDVALPVTALSATGPAEAVQAFAAGWSRVDEAPGWSLVLECDADAEPAAVLAVWQRVRRTAVALAGCSLRLQTPTADWQAWSPLLEQVRAADQRWQIVLEHPKVEAESVLEALALGASRLVVTHGLADSPMLIGHLRAHRVAVVVLPTALAALRPVRDAGLLLCVGSGVHADASVSLTQGLERASQTFGWRLDDLRSATQRATESLWATPAARFALARRVEAWRHRPHPTAAPNADPFSL